MAGFALERQKVEKRCLLVRSAGSAGECDEAALPHCRARAVVVGIEAHCLDSPADAVVARQLRQVRPVLVARAGGTDGFDHCATEAGRVTRERVDAVDRQYPVEQRAQWPVGGEGIVGERGAPRREVTPGVVERHARSLSDVIPASRRLRASGCR